MRRPAPRARPIRARPQHAFSLVELLVSMTLGLLLLGGMIALFSGNRRTADINAAMTSMQANVRFAMNVIASDIRMAGHQGCLDSNGAPITVIANDAQTSDLRVSAIAGSVIGVAGAWSPAIVLGSGVGRFTPPLTHPAVPGTHAIALQFGGPESTTVAPGGMLDGGNPDPAAMLPLDGGLDVEAGDLALVSTCEDGELFRVSAVTNPVPGQLALGHDASVNTRGSFLEAYGVDGTHEEVRVMTFSSHVYYIGETGVDNSEGEPIRALYQLSAPFGDAANPPVELVHGVENLRLSFGIGTGGGRVRYVTADDAAYDPTRIKSVRLGLLMSSAEPIAADIDKRTYVLAGQSIEPSATADDATTHKTDKRFRLAFNTTVKVRNRRATD